jgi:hypothetical protein
LVPNGDAGKRDTDGQITDFEFEISDLRFQISDSKVPACSLLYPFAFTLKCKKPDEWPPGECGDYRALLQGGVVAACIVSH